MNYTKIQSMYVADFETCDNPTQNQEGTYKIGDKEYPLYPQRVWYAGLQNIHTKHIDYFTSIDTFMQHILNKKFHQNQSLEIAFHNLRFDGTYIIPYLMHNGYYNVISKPKSKEFTVLIDERNSWYSIRIQIHRNVHITIWDSAKLFPMPLRELPSLYHTPTKKLVEDDEFYNRVRLPGYTPNEQETAYLHNDLQVLSETIEKHIDIYGECFKKTQASQSFANFKNDFPFWKKRFGYLTDQQDKMCREAYAGGISYVNPDHQYKDLYNLASYDIVSSYPSQLATKKFPYGKPLFARGVGQDPDFSKFFVGAVHIKFKLKKNCLPCIPKMWILDDFPIEPIETSEKWLVESPGFVELAITSIDYYTILESYEIEILEWQWTIHFKQKTCKEIRDFVLKNFKIKQECKKKIKELVDAGIDDIERINELKTKAQRAKINLNSFYGKFGEQIIKYNKLPVFDDEEQVDKVFYRLNSKTIQSKHQRKYLPIAIATTAYGRAQLVQFANILGEHFVYCDTDSVHYLRDGQYKLDNAKDINFNSEELGAWEFEDNYTFGRYLRPKCYMEETEQGELNVTLAGMPADKGEKSGSKKRSIVTKENFHMEQEYPGGNGRLRVIQTSTGAKLVTTDFKINQYFSVRG